MSINSNNRMYFDDKRFVFFVDNSKNIIIDWVSASLVDALKCEDDELFDVLHKLATFFKDEIQKQSLNSRYFISSKIENNNESILHFTFEIIKHREDEREVYACEVAKNNNGSKIDDFCLPERQSYLINNFHEGIVIIKNGKVEYINQKFLDITGYSYSELAELIINFNFTIPEERNYTIAKFDFLRRNKQKNHVFEFSIISKQGEKKHLQNTYSSYYKGDDTVEYLVSQDVTDRYKLKLEKEKIEKGFSALTENSTNVIMQFNRELNCTYVNIKGVELLGRSKDDLHNVNLNLLGFNEAVNELIKRNLIEVFSTREIARFEDYVEINSDKKFIQFSIIPEVIGERAVDTIFLIGHDITELKNKQIEINQGVEHFEMIINNLSDAIWVLDTDFKIAYITPSIKYISGYSVEEYRSLEYTDIYPSETLQRINLIFGQIKQSAKLGKIFQVDKVFELQGQQIRKDGTRVWIEFNAKVVLNKLGEFVGLQGITRNITNRKEVELELIKANKKAIEADRLKSSFLANMSHEIRTPMNAIIGFSELLDDEYLEQEKRSEFIQLINSNSEQLLKLIDDIIDISKIEANEVTVKLEKVNINKLLNSLYIEYTRKINSESKPIDIKFDIPLKEIIIDTDIVRLKQIFYNIINNSLKFTNKGKISIGVIIDNNDNIKFYVKDTGIGMSNEQIKYIFDRFRQIDDKVNRGYQGAGLGLSISKQLVELLGGKIWVDSKLGEGSVFYFTLPYSVSEEDRSEALKGMISDDLLSVLVVEDEDANFFLLKEILKKRNYRIVRARDGQEAVDLTNEEDFDLVLMDIQLPKLNGFEATKIIRKTNNNIPIIAQTAYANYNYVVQSLDAGCNDFIAKPIKSKKLFSLIDKYLNAEN